MLAPNGQVNSHYCEFFLKCKTDASLKSSPDNDIPKYLFDYHRYYEGPLHFFQLFPPNCKLHALEFDIGVLVLRKGLNMRSEKFIDEAMLTI